MALQPAGGCHGMFSAGIYSVLWPAEGAVYSANLHQIWPLWMYRVGPEEKVVGDLPGGL